MPSRTVAIPDAALPEASVRVLASSAVETWRLVVSALGLAVFMEGLPYFVAPRGVRRTMAALITMRDGELRGIGLVLMVLGLLIAYASTR